MTMSIALPAAPRHGLLALSLLAAMAPALAQDSASERRTADEADEGMEWLFGPTPTPAPEASTEPAGPGEPTPSVPLRSIVLPEPTPAPRRPSASGRVLDEIVVTATKRESSARDIPVSINATSGEALENMGARDIQDYIATIPGISLQESPNGDAGGRKLSVRGVGPSQVNEVSGNQTVGQFIGDFPMTDPYSNYVTPDLDPFDLQSVEILKGPQGTYFGASALNGAIRYVPTKPQLGQWATRGFVEGLKISDGGLDATYAAAVNVPLGDSLALRGTGVLQRTPGVIDNLQRGVVDADSRDKWSGRAALYWAPSDRLDVQLMFLKQESDKHDVLDVDNATALTNNQRPGPSNIESGFDLGSLDVRYDAGSWGTLVLQSSLQHKHVLGDVDATLFTGEQGAQNFRAFSSTAVEGTTHELRLVSPGDGLWSWIAGVFLLDYQADVFTDAYLPGTASPVPAPPPLDGIIGPNGVSYGSVRTAPEARETSLYGELARQLGQAWELTLGARLYRTRIFGTYAAGGLLGGAVPDVDIDLRENGISPKLSLAWRPSEDLMAYATIARGFQFGGINTQTSGVPFENPATGPTVPPSFGSSSLWSREIGLRTDWFERTLRADLVIYDLDWSDAQFVEANDNLIIDTQYVSNVGKVRSQGAEGSIIYLPPIEGLSLNLALGYSRALTASPYTAQNGTEVPAGTEMPNSPRWQLASSLAYERGLGAWTAAGSLIHTYASRAYDTIVHDNEIFDFGAFNLGLSLSRPDLSGAPSLSFSVTNLLNTRGVVGRNSFTGTSGLTGEEIPSFIFVRPRAFTLRLSYEFS